MNAIHANGTTALIGAVSNGNVKSASFLLKKGVDINSKDCFGNTVFRIAIRFQYTDCTKLLIKEGIDVNRFPAEDETPLTQASKSKGSSSLKLLLEAGVDVNAENSRGNSALNLYPISQSR